MKAFLGIALALSLLGTSAVAAAPYGGYAHARNDNGALFAGLGILALTAILASQNSHRYQPYDRGYGDRGYGYNTPGRDRYDGNRYDRSYDNRQYGYGNQGRW